MPDHLSIGCCLCSPTGQCHISNTKLPQFGRENGNSRDKSALILQFGGISDLTTAHTRSGSYPFPMAYRDTLFLLT
jgi:hypothetical protein